MNYEAITASDELWTCFYAVRDVVVDVFNRVNSGGTKLSKGDLALAKICAVGRKLGIEVG